MILKSNLCLVYVIHTVNIHVSVPWCHLQGVLQIKGTQAKHHVNLGTSSSSLELLKY